MANYVPIPLQVQYFDPMDSLQRAEQMKQQRQARELQALQLAQAQQQQAERQSINDAYKQAFVPAQSAQYAEPGMSIGGMNLPGRTMSVSNPAHIDQSQLLSSIGQVAPQYVPKLQAEFDQQAADKAEAERKAQHDAQMAKLEEAMKSGQIDEQKRKQMAVAAEMVAKAAGVVKLAPPEQRAVIYKSAMQGLAAQAGQNPFLAQMLQSAPADYSPEVEANLDTYIMQGMSVADIAKRVYPEPKKQVPGVDVPFSPEVERQKVRISQAGKASSGNGTSIPSLTSLKPAQMALVDEIGQGKMTMGRLEYIAARNPDLLAAVAQKYPDFDQSKIKSYGQAYRDFTGAGKYSNQLNAGSTALRHLAELYKINEENPVAVHNPATAAYKRYHNLLDTVTDELVTFYGEPKTNEVIASKKATLGGVLNRGAAIKEQAKAMGVKFDELENTWQNAAPSSAWNRPMPNYSQQAMDARAYLDPEYEQRIKGQAQPNPTPQGGGTVTMRAPNGQTSQVPVDQVEHYKALGATVVR